MGDSFHRLSRVQSFKGGEWIIHLHVVLVVSNCQATPHRETSDNVGCISCLFLKRGFSGFRAQISVIDLFCDGWEITLGFQYTWLKTQNLLLLLWNRHRAQGSRLLQDINSPSAWVMSQRPGEHRGAFVALSVPTFEQHVSSVQNIFLVTGEHAVLAEWHSYIQYSVCFMDTKDEGFSVNLPWPVGINHSRCDFCPHSGIWTFFFRRFIS